MARPPGSDRHLRRSAAAAAIGMIAIRACGPEHCEPAAALWARCGLTRPWNDPVSDFRLALSGPSSTVLGGFAGVAMIASVMTGFDGHRGWLYYLAVDPAYRRRGLGSQMVQAAEAWLRDRGAPKLQFMVREENAAALRFYATLGFERQSVITLGRRLDGASGGVAQIGIPPLVDVR